MTVEHDGERAFRCRSSASYRGCCRCYASIVLKQAHCCIAVLFTSLKIEMFSSTSVNHWLLITSFGWQLIGHCAESLLKERETDKCVRLWLILMCVYILAKLRLVLVLAKCFSLFFFRFFLYSFGNRTLVACYVLINGSGAH